MRLLYDLLGFELANLNNIAERLLRRCAVDAHVVSETVGRILLGLDPGR
jgi:hypothetical protein